MQVYKRKLSATTTCNWSHKCFSGSY